MDTSDSKIKFNEDGICDHCITFDKEILPNWNYGINKQKEVKEIVKKIKKRSAGNEFDCILGLSGGIDSSFLLHLVVTEYNLRPLVFHVDGGWNSQLATNNIEKLIDKLNLELYTHVVNWNEMQDLQLSFFKSGVPHIDVPQDYAFFSTMYNFASKYNVKTIVTGGNFSTECVRNPKEWMYYQSDTIQLKDIQKKHGKRKLKEYQLTNILWHKLWLPYIKGVKLIRLIDYMPYNKKEAENILVNNYGFQTYPQKHFESRFTRFYESYWLYERFGYDTRRVQFSSLILTNQMTREEALKELETAPYDKENIIHEFEYVANKLNISTSELRNYFNMPLKTYCDYKNQENLYNLGAQVLKSLKIEKGGKR
tara:strand:+ start:1255 stop:2355 length:1101 start_codon:yes stop_codon:yes gene_type:complete